MGTDMHGPRWGIGHVSGSAMLLVPDRKWTEDVLGHVNVKANVHSLMCNEVK